MNVDYAVIGGTGVGSRLLELGGSALHVPTPAGTLRGRLLQVDRHSVLLLGRHGAGHKVPPHRVNYAAMALGLQQLGVRGCLSTAAVGSLRPEWPRGTMVVCSDFLDLSDRRPTLFDSVVEHRDFTDPFAPNLRSALLSAAHQSQTPVQDGGVYLSLNGPRYETPQEIRTFAGLGADLVGMTAGTEAVLMREAQVPYACLAIVTNLAAGLEIGPLDHGDVGQEMARHGEVAVRLLLTTLASLP